MKLLKTAIWLPGGTAVLPYQYFLCKKNRSVPLEITKEMNKYHLMKTLCPRHSYDTPKEVGGDLSNGVFTYCTFTLYAKCNGIFVCEDQWRTV